MNDATTRSALFTLALLSHAPMANADALSFAKQSEFSLALGAAYSDQDSLYQGAKMDESALPILEVFWGPLFFSDGQLGSFVAGDHNWAVSVSLSQEAIETSKRHDSPRLSDMGELEEVYNASISMTYWDNWGEVSLGLTTDISQRHKGQSLHLGYHYTRNKGHHLLSPYLEGTLMDREISEYYYGVQAQHQTKDRAAYQPGTALKLGIGLSYYFSLNKHHSILMNAEWNIASEEIRRSPIVSRSNSKTWALGYVYEF